MGTKWEVRGIELVNQLKTATDEVAIQALAEEVIQEIVNAYSKVSSRKTPLSDVRKTVLAAFPDSDKQTSNFQYFTNSGKGSVGRYQHVALRYLTLSQQDWDTLRDTSKQKAEPQATSPEEIVTQLESTKLPEFKLSDMQIDQLELDIETQENVQTALQNSGKSLSEFIQAACKSYANICNRGRTDVDLSGVLTSELLDPEIAKYKSHPGKIRELTRRAMLAIMRYNDDCTETDQKWFISGTSIHGLTGSRVQSVNEILTEFKQMVDDHNDKHGLTAYTNRGKKREIKLEIPLNSLVPDGMDL